MKNDWMNRIFKHKAGLSREDIDAYGKSTDERIKQGIEERSLASAFDADAMEGWSELSYDTTAMNRLDKRFAHRSGFSYTLTLVGIAGVIVISMISFYYFNQSPDKAKKTQIAQEDGREIMEELRIDESDILIPDEIEAMTEAPSREQIRPEVIKTDFRELKQISDEGQRIVVKELPLIDPEKLSPAEPAAPVSKRINAKEIYLADLKLIDYREYRSRPVVKTKQMILTGVPASKESAESEEMTSEWKDIDIPYMEYIEKSVRLFNKGNNKKALTRFQTVLETYKDDVNALFYAGLCMYNLKEYDNAIGFFESCLKSPYSNFDEEAQWMLALSAEKSGRNETAQKYFQIIAEQNGFYSEQARAKTK